MFKIALAFVIAIPAQAFRTLCIVITVQLQFLATIWSGHGYGSAAAAVCCFLPCCTPWTTVKAATFFVNAVRHADFGKSWPTHWCRRRQASAEGELSFLRRRNDFLQKQCAKGYAGKHHRKKESLPTLLGGVRDEICARAVSLTLPWTPSSLI